MRSRFSLLAAFVVGCLITAAVLVGVGPKLGSGIGAFSRPVPTVLAESPPPGPGADANQVRNAASRVAPAVVDIHTVGKALQSEPQPFSDDPFFRRFFGGPGPDGGSQPERVVPRGAGSGVIISADGYIITNAHVVDTAERVSVQVGDKGYDARIIGKDEVSDIAVVKIDAGGAKLPAVTLGNSDDVRVGDWAIAVGNPLDVGTSVTFGIVSAINRSLQNLERPSPLLRYYSIRPHDRSGRSACAAPDRTEPYMLQPLP